MKLRKSLLACFCSLVFACNIFGQTEQKASLDIEQIIKILTQAAKILEYKSLKSTLHPDKWKSEEKKDLIEDHAYYSLIGKDSDHTCTSSRGYILVTILIFKDADLAHQQIEERKKYHLGNVVKSIKSDDTGYFLEEVNGIYGAVVQNAKVIFFEDRSSEQGKVIKSLIEIWSKQ